MSTNIINGRFARLLTWLSALVLIAGSLLAFYRPASVQAAEVQNRSIELGTSEEDAETTYIVQFTVPAGTTMGAFVVEFCDNDPLPHTTCTYTETGDDIPCVAADEAAGADGLCGTAVSLNAGSSVTNATGGDCDNLTLTAPVLDDRHLLVECDAADNLGGLASTVTLIFDDVDNPDNGTDSPNNPNNTFYARVYVYADETPPAVANPISATEIVHTGGIAMSTAEQLTITARVQEILEFCVGTLATAATSPADCTGMTGNAVDLGVLDFSGVTLSTDAATDNKGSILVRTNAATGVVVDYFAEQATTGTEHLGALRVAGATCNAGVVTTDQCINSVGTTQDVIAAGAEEFGFCALYDNSSSTGTTTNNLQRLADFDGNCDNSGGNGFAFDETGTIDTIADSVGSGGVVNDEGLHLIFAGTSSVTTPTGLYNVTLTFIGTATF